MSKKGFTLVELIVVVVVIGILSSLIFIYFRGGEEIVVKTKRAADVEILKNAIVSYRNENYDNYLPESEECVLSGKNSNCDPLFLEDLSKIIGPLPEPEDGFEYKFSLQGEVCTISVYDSINGTVEEYDCSKEFIPITDFPIAGVCGSTSRSFLESAPEETDSNLCFSGTLGGLDEENNFIYEPGYGWLWNCLGINDGASSSCIAYSHSSLLSCRIVEDGVCQVSEENSDDASINSVNVLNISSKFGGHAEMTEDENNPSYAPVYTSKVCCEAPNLENKCPDQGGIAILKLYQSTNSHVEQVLSTGNTYTKDVCLSVPGKKVSCFYSFNESSVFDEYCSEEEGYDCVVSISGNENDSTNLHVGDCNAYPKKVCCKVEIPDIIEIIND